MLGVNIGVPVPREPFSFGGLEGTRSKFGGSDVTGVGCLNFMTKRRKITTKWNVHPGVAAVCLFLSACLAFLSLSLSLSLPLSLSLSSTLSLHLPLSRFIFLFSLAS